MRDQRRKTTFAVPALSLTGPDEVTREGRTKREPASKGRLKSDVMSDVMETERAERLQG